MASVEEREYLEFQIDTELLAIPLERIREAVRLVRISKLPGTSGPVRGVINYRGQIVPVFDTHARFNLTSPALDPRHFLIIVTTATRPVALYADRLGDIVSFTDDHIDRAVDTMSGNAHLSGIARTSSGVTVICDVDKFLSDDEQIRLSQALDKLENQDEVARRHDGDL